MSIVGIYGVHKRFKEKKLKILVTGSAGFICGYTIEELLNNGHEIVGIDNYSKYGKIKKSYDSHPHYTFVEDDVKNTSLIKELIADCDQVLPGQPWLGESPTSIKTHMIYWRKMNGLWLRRLRRQFGHINIKNCRK